MCLHNDNKDSCKVCCRSELVVTMITVLCFIPDDMIQANITITCTKCYYCPCRFREAVSSFQCHIWQSSDLCSCLFSFKALDPKHYVDTSPSKWAKVGSLRDQEGEKRTERGPHLSLPLSLVHGYTALGLCSDALRLPRWTLSFLCLAFSLLSRGAC